MTIVPRTGPLSASSALATTSWYHRGKSSDCDVNTPLAMGGRGYRGTGEGPCPFLTGPDGLPPRRGGPDGAVQLAVRPSRRRHVRPAHRGHRRGDVARR